ncbi:MAG: hypothetical protein FD152_4506 [Xanthobacteraceae bacterium]|nr:MAG: hypothetical protein FD152_4506 [Xanthobacteraceae bacterium]
MDIAQILQALAGGAPVAAVLGYALWVVWGRYQEALAEIKKMSQDSLARERQLVDAALKEDDHGSGK